MDGNWYLDINGVSRHSEPREERTQDVAFSIDGKNYVIPGKKEKKYNESNPGLGIRYEWGPEDLRKFIIAGQYKNSLNDLSTYAAGGLKNRLLGNDSLHLDAGALAGLISGYGDGLTPALMPVVSIGGKQFGVNVLYAPKVQDSPETFMLNASYKLK